MALIRMLYDMLHNGPFFMSDGATGAPSNHAPDAKVLNIGDSTYPIKSSTSGNVVNIRGQFSHTSGDARCIYNRLYLEGSSGGDAMRVFTTVNSNVNTARGMHVSLNFDATAGGSECSGTGTPMTCTLHIPNVASWSPSGTYYGHQIQIYSDGAASDPDGMTVLAGLCIENAGNATGRADVDDDAYIMDFPGWTPEDGDTGLTSAFTTGCADIGAASNLTAAMKIRVGGTDYWIPLATSISGDGA